MNQNGDLPERGDIVFDGGNLDCGSGLVLLIREHMSRVPGNGILELRSSEPTVALDLPPWCSMVGHTLLGSRTQNQLSTYFIQKGGSKLARREEQSLQDDKKKAREYVWRLRTRSSDALKSTVYCRNFSFPVGQPASFEGKDKYPSAIEYLLGSLAGSLCTAFTTACSQKGLKIDDIEISAQGRIVNILSHLGIEAGDPSLEAIDISCYASTFEDSASVQEVWEAVISRCPVTQTLIKGVRLNTKLNIV